MASLNSWKSTFALILTATALVWSLAPSSSFAAPTAQQRKELGALKAEIKKAGILYKQEKYKESGEMIRRVQGRFDTLSTSRDRTVILTLLNVYNSLIKAHALLELEGIDLPKLVKPELSTGSKKPGSPKPGDKPATGNSFVKEVAPMLIAKCGRCHISNTRGMFSLATYTALMRGTNNAKVVSPGDGDGSRIVEMIESGEMPKGGGKVSAAELAALKKWIVSGAKFDGPNPQANLTTLVPAVRIQAGPKVAVVQSTGKETVSFARDIAPVLAERCINCHGNTRPRNRFNLFTFAGMLRGGDNGAPVLPRNPSGSLLIKMLKGTGDGPRMPQNAPPLSDETIAKFEKWISEGATFDGPAATQSVVVVAALDKARRSTHEELSAARVELAQKNWRLGMPDTKAEQTETEHFLVLGDVGENSLLDIAKEAEKVAPRVAALFKAPSSKPLIKGRMTLFVFSRRYDYSEFGQMVEKRQIPKQWRGHWQYTIVDSYGALTAPKNEDDFNVSSMLAQELSGTYVASLGQSPHWFREGSARAAAARLSPSDSRILEWDAELSRILGTMSKPDDFLTGKLSAEDTDIASYSFAKLLMKDQRRYKTLLDALRGGQDFGKSFAAIYGGTPNQVSGIWVQNAGSKKSRRKSRSRSKS